MLFAGLLWGSPLVEAAGTNASAPVSMSKAAGSSLVVSQEIARFFLASARAPKPWTNYVGDEACLPCHQDKVITYHQTAHYLASSWPTKDTVRGSFTSGSNVLQTGNTNLLFKLDATEKGFFQTAVETISSSEFTQHTERIDIVFGSGRKGQTFLFWLGDSLYELPVSYWVERGTWMNSPNLQLYPDGTANFTRAITPRCLECHVTSFAWLDPFAGPGSAGIRFSRYTNLVLGITCEKCHGPGRDHIARYRSSSPPISAAAAASAIINPARLPRDRQMDACSLCHAGAGIERSPALSFNVGDVLSNHLELQVPGPDAPVDVHGNQIQGLERSRCFQSSPTMTCLTCHDVHAPHRDLKAFAARCLTCHKVERCGEFRKLGHAIDTQCAVCHMPVQPTDTVQSVTKGERFQPKYCNHQIAIYRDVRLP
ncbi:MAG TPA: multiheme c-type cytochrome [Candidatus Acidoferrum sp.]|nr:multiheme c-type cytochrome [Candidatus Acidoferrum sp.]